MKRAISDDQKEQRRHALMVAALDVFFEKGFAAAKIDEIAAKAGVSKGVVYLYFDSKQSLFEALLDEFATPNVDALISHTEKSDPIEALNDIASFAPLMVRTTPLPRLAKILIGESSAVPHFARLYKERIINRGLAAMERLIERGVSRGDFAPCEPKIAAKLIAAPLILSMVWIVVFEPIGAEPLDVEKVFRTQIGLLTQSLGTSGETL